MDGRTDIPLTPPYMRDLSIAAIAAANPSAGYTSAAAAAAPAALNARLVRGLFMSPWTSAWGGVTPSPVVKPRSSASKRTMAAPHAFA